MKLLSVLLISIIGFSAHAENADANTTRLVMSNKIVKAVLEQSASEALLKVKDCQVQVEKVGGNIYQSNLKVSFSCVGAGSSPEVHEFARFGTIEMTQFDEQTILVDKIEIDSAG